jgi:hypothetical protein
VPQQYGSVDPRAQTEDLGDDPVRASTLAIANMKRVVPNLVAWTTKPGEDYDDLNELYGEALGMWSLYMGHVATVIGGVNVDFKTADQQGPVYHVVPRARQKAALDFLAEQAIRSPAWLAPEDIISRVGPGSGTTSLAGRQSALLTQLLSAQRLERLSISEAMDATNAYPLTEYLSDLKRVVWGAPGATYELDAGRRTLHRVYLERLEALISPPAPPAAAGPGGGGGGGAGPQQQLPFLVAPNVPRSDLPALARSQLRAVRDQARTATTTAAAPMARAHWQDIADRIDAILEPRRGR